VDLHVAGAFELFVDNLVHFGPGINQCRRENSQATTLFYIACSTKETLRPVQCVGIDTTRQDFAR
jgi:hypothetical protein